MGHMLVRDVDDEVIRHRKRRAAVNGRSAEAEHRAILEAAVRVAEEPPVTMARRFLQEIAATDLDSADMVRAQREERALR